MRLFINIYINKTDESCGLNNEIDVKQNFNLHTSEGLNNNSND
jgi:hypothetical protein